MADEDLSKLKIEKTPAKTGIRRRKRPFIWVMAAVIILAAVLAATGVLTREVEVKTAVASMIYPTQTFTRLDASGYVVAQRKAAVAGKVTGRLDWLGVKEGSHVKKGEIIARLEDQDVLAAESQAKANLSGSKDALKQALANIINAKAALDQAKAELNDAKLNIDRQRELLKKGFVAKSDYDSAEARYKKAVAGVEGAKAAIRANEAAKNEAESAISGSAAALKGAEVSVEYTLIRAPFDAVVLTKNADLGDIVTPIGASTNAQAAVVTIADMDSLEVEADVSEANLELVHQGQPCEVQLDALPGSRFRGEVSVIVPTADRTKASVMVKVKFLDKDPRILPEMSAKVAFLAHEPSPEDRKPLLAVNPAALTERRGKQAVFVIKNGRAVLTPVRIGKKLGDWVEVTSGLKPGDKVAVSNVDKLKNGSKIKEAVE
jgi:RND family efflux transporter MFP subunit